MDKFNVKIKCRVQNSISNYSFRILIYDRNNNVIKQMDTTHNQIQVLLKEGVYKVVIISNCTLSPSILCETILVSEKSPRCFCFYFRDMKNLPRQRITVWLTDANYNNLAIEKGEITLWKSLI